MKGHWLCLFVVCDESEVFYLVIAARINGWKLVGEGTELFSCFS